MITNNKLVLECEIMSVDSILHLQTVHVTRHFCQEHDAHYIDGCFSWNLTSKKRSQSVNRLIGLKISFNRIQGELVVFQSIF